jgi:hypothetical protein
LGFTQKNGKDRQQHAEKKEKRDFRDVRHAEVHNDRQNTQSDCPQYAIVVALIVAKREGRKSVLHVDQAQPVGSLVLKFLLKDECWLCLETWY